MERSTAFQCGAVTLEVLTLLCMTSWIWHPNSRKTIPSSRTMVQALMKWCRKPMSQETFQELDLLRCKKICRIWQLILAGIIIRTIVGQVLLAFGSLSSMADYDLAFFVQGFLALLVTWKPQIITPKTVDASIITCLFAWNGCLLPVLDRLDVRDVVTLSFSFRFVFLVMAQRNSTIFLGMGLNFLQTYWMASVQSDLHLCSSLIQLPIYPLLVTVLVVMLVGLYIARNLMEENATLKHALEGRTVELGVVTSLLNASYDAVVEVDDSWKLLGESTRLLSTMLGYGESEAGEVRSSLLDFFTEEDQERISQQVRSSIKSESTSVMALNADMLTLDQTPVKVELFHAQFRSLANQRCFLVGLRELSDEPFMAEATSSCSSKEVVASEDLFVAFDVENFNMFILSSAMERWCQEELSKIPESVLEISSAPEALRSQLQHLEEMKVEQETTLRFNLIGAGEVSASLSLEHDASLGRMVGILTIPCRSKSTDPAGALTQEGSQGAKQPNPLRGFS
ncbi:unnamed protein product [Durusdinium trenchii]|uniref:PAS domain-containing protein n=1 Tax=Durusdinium trenchii TaxID=1381693 RepID=A0ABP0I975_9DINO